MTAQRDAGLQFALIKEILDPKAQKRPREEKIKAVPKPTRNRPQAHESRIYSEYAALYDKTFGKIFYEQIRRAIKSLGIPPGARVLELGVGTGTSFPAYPRHCEVIGMDLAADMVPRA